MLKKLFHTSHHSNNHHSSGSSLTSKSSVLDRDDWDEHIGYVKTLEQLDQFEARLRELLRTLTRQCQAIVELCSSTSYFSDYLDQLLSRSSEPTPSAPVARQGDEALGLVNMFRVSAIAPLQSLLILVPQLRVRCEHRKSAMQLMVRYQRKVQDIDRVSKVKTVSARLRRNRAKLQAATARFRELDTHVQHEIKIVVSNNLAAIAGPPTSELLVRAQLLAGQFIVENASRMQIEAQPAANETDKQPTSPEETEEPGEKYDLQQVPTPQRRLAMTVLPPASQDNSVDVRQSVLAPPSVMAPTAVVELVSLRRPSSTATDDEEDERLRGVDDESSGYRTVPEIHEDFGIGKCKKHDRGSRRWDIHRHIKENMSTGLDLVECVHLPDGFSRDEWIAVHVVDFFNEINLLYGTISEFCTANTCPKMSAGPCYTYTWTDSVSSTQQAPPMHLPASQYVARLMDWIEGQINDHTVFPTGNSEYQADFASTARVMLKRLFRVYAHMYHSHLEHFAELSADVHLGFCFKRFVFFVREFDLVEQRELNALYKLIQSVLDDPVGDLAPSELLA